MGLTRLACISTNILAAFGSWGGASRRLLGLLFLHLFCMIFQLFLAVLLCFSTISAEKIGFPGPFCPGPIWGLPNYFRYDFWGDCCGGVWGAAAPLGQTIINIMVFRIALIFTGRSCEFCCWFLSIL